MTLDEIVKMLAGAGTAFAFGAGWGYATAARFEQINRASPKKPGLNLLDNALVSFWGAYTQNYFGHQDQIMLITSMVGGVIGGLVGKIAGRYWRRRCNNLDKNRLLVTEEEQKRLDEYVIKGQRLAATDLPAYKRFLDDEFVLYWSSLSGNQVSCSQMAKKLLETVSIMEDYAETYRTLAKLLSVSALYTVAMKPKNTESPEGIFYCIGKKFIQVANIELSAQPLASQSPESPAYLIEASLNKFIRRDWNGDLDTLAQEILSQKKIVMLSKEDPSYKNSSGWIDAYTTMVSRCLNENPGWIKKMRRNMSYHGRPMMGFGIKVCAESDNKIN